MSKGKMQLIQDLVTIKETCVLATSDGARPHCSMMHFFADHATMKFYFLAAKSSTASKDLKKCPYVSILIEDRDTALALTIDGLNSPIGKRQTVDAIVHLYLTKYPKMRELADNPDVELIRIMGRSATMSQGFTNIFKTKLTNS